MAEWWFYHLERAGPEEALPPLVEKCLERGWRVLVSSPYPDRLSALDEALWTQDAASFLPHAREGAPGMAAGRQPVLLSTATVAANGAEALILLDGQAAPEEGGAAFQRCMVMVDGGDSAALQTARAQFKAARDAGLEPKYFQQTPSGGWAQKA